MDPKNYFNRSKILNRNRRINRRGKKSVNDFFNGVREDKDTNSLLQVRLENNEFVLFSLHH